MWILILYMTLTPGVGYPLERYPTKPECYQELFRIQADMLKAYADEPQTWRLECRKATNG